MPARVRAPRPNEPGDFLAAYPPPVRRLALRARDLMLARQPGLTEKVWPGWKVIGIGTGPRMSDVVVGLGPAKGHLTLHLARGVDLPDPSGLLEGTSKTGRHVKVRSLEELESGPVQALVDGAFRLAAAKSPPSARRAAAARSPGGLPASWKPPVGDDAVREKTGRSWDEWITALDAEGCAKMTHPEIVAVVGGKFGAAPWWQQMVTVGYERARGLRQVHETTQGYQVGGSKTVNVDLATLWRAWADARVRKRWLPDAFTVRKATDEKSMRITWNDGSDLQVLLYAKGDDKSQVTVDHRKLPQSRVAEMKAFWKGRLEDMKRQLESVTARGR